MLDNLTQRLGRVVKNLRGQARLTEDNVGEMLREVRMALLEADVALPVVKDFIAKVKEKALGQEVIGSLTPGQALVGVVHRELTELMGGASTGLNLATQPPAVILMSGLQGAGKTTTCAKLAKRMRDTQGRRPLLVAADVKRPAAVEQLRVLGRQLNVPVFHKDGADPVEQCVQGLIEARRQGLDFVILDTAGRLHIDAELMDEVKRIAAAVKPTATVLVVDAMTGQDAVNSAKAFNEALELSGVILTKLDGDARGGAAVSLKAITGKPILFAGVGEKIDDLDAFYVERMAGRILGMGDVVGLVEKAQSAISEKEAQASFEKLVMGDFTLEDMLAQLRMIRKLGPMKKVLGMMPGMGQHAGALDIDEKQMNRLEALFTSMTPRERLQPDVIDMSRRRRIAKGAGQEIAAVNELLKRHKDMKLLMRQLNKMGLASQFGAKQKEAALKGLSDSGELASESGGGGLLGGLGSGLGSLGKGIGGLFGGGGGMPQLPPGMGPGMGPGAGPGMGGANPFGTRPMGSSATRQSGKKKKKKR